MRPKTACKLAPKHASHRRSRQTTTGEDRMERKTTRQSKHIPMRRMTTRHSTFKAEGTNPPLTSYSSRCSRSDCISANMFSKSCLTISRASGVRKGASRPATAPETLPGPPPCATRTVGSGPPPRAGCAGAVGGSGRCCGVKRYTLGCAYILVVGMCLDKDTYAVDR